MVKKSFAIVLNKILPSKLMGRSIVLLILAGIIVLIVFVYQLMPTDCEKLEKEIMQRLEGINHCADVSDCIVEMKYGCPFGCYQYCNKDEDLTSLNNLVEAYQEKNCNICVYSCLRPPQADELGCVGGKCVELRIS